MNWYNLCKKYKILDWIDDNIIWYIYNKPKSFIKTVRYWFYCNWNKEHWKLVKSTIVSYPWDYYFMYETLECYIDKQLRWFKKHQIVENCEEDIIRPLKWAKHCLHMINHDEKLSSYDFKTHKSTYLGPKINYKTLDRYLSYQNMFRPGTDKNEIKKYYINYPQEFYILKCNYILFKILLQYSHKWWD